MAPFGKKWFKVLNEPDHPIAILRLEWIYLNIGEDRRRTAERRKEEIEYGGLFSGPEVYAHIKGLDTGGGEGGGSSPFKLVYDTSDHDRKLQLAIKGMPDIPPQRMDIAARVAQVRAAREREGAPRPPRPAIVPDMGYDDMDGGLEIEDPDGTVR